MTMSSTITDSLRRALLPNVPFLSARQWLIAVFGIALSAWVWWRFTGGWFVPTVTIFFGLYDALGSSRETEKPVSRFGRSFIYGGFGAGMYHYIVGK